MEASPLFFWKVVQCVFLYGFVVKYFGTKLCRAALKGFDDLTDKKKNAFKLEIVFFFYAIIVKCVGYYLILFDENIRQDNLWNSTLANWNYAMAIGGVLADTMFRIIWKIKPFLALLLHFVYVIGNVGLIMPVNKAILCLVNVKLMLFIPTPLIILRCILNDIKLKETMLIWKFKFLGFAADAILGFLFLPFYYILAFYMAEEFWAPDPVNYEHLIVGFVFSLPIDITMLSLFNETCDFFFNRGMYDEKQTTK
ncbi:unnamed protein product [Clavelina lepadiformis]|uniref:Transmembrane protein n=1 Tax=Clavelina lepadiformis TaxID=159417 RepID=A0ABP0FLE1_CLALP